MIKNYINGDQISYSSQYIPVYDPSKGEKIDDVVNSNLEDFNYTIKSAKLAFEMWSQITPLKRSRIISKYKEILEKNV